MLRLLTVKLITQFQKAIYLWRKLTDAFDIKGPQDISAEIQLGLYTGNTTLQSPRSHTTF